VSLNPPSEDRGRERPPNPAPPFHTPPHPRPLWSVFVRGWALDASWHPERMQGHGVVHALAPLLRRQGDVTAALRRHAVAFGCNLWTAPVLLGAMARLESEARGDAATALRDRLAGPLSGAGDVHAWRAVRPASLVVALLGVLCGHAVIGLVAALMLHDAALAWRQLRGFARGWRGGAELPAAFATLIPPPRLGLWLQRGLVLVAGAFAGWGVVSGWQVAASHAFLMGGALLVGYYAAQRQLPPGITFVGLVWVASWLRRFSNPVGLP